MAYSLDGYMADSLRALLAFLARRSGRQEADQSVSVRVDDPEIDLGTKNQPVAVSGFGDVDALTRQERQLSRDYPICKALWLLGSRLQLFKRMLLKHSFQDVLLISVHSSLTRTSKPHGQRSSNQTKNCDEHADKNHHNIEINIMKTSHLCSF